MYNTYILYYILHVLSTSYSHIALCDIQFEYHITHIYIYMRE